MGRMMDEDEPRRFDETAGSRALVACGAADPAPPGPRPLAPFLTQLFACEARLEGFRRHRRAGPACASASYAASDQTDGGVAARFERVL